MTVGDLVERLAGWIERLTPAEERRDRLVVELRERFGGGRPEITASVGRGDVTASVGRGDVTAGKGRAEVTAGVCREIEQVAWEHSRHLLLVFEADGTAPADEESKGWPPDDPDEARKRAAGVGEVRRLDGGACLIRVDGLDAVGVARPFVEAAFTLAAGAERILLDLRGNGGGDPATVALIAGRLLGDAAEQLSDVVYRDRRRQWWTPDLAPGTALTQPVAVLVGEGTFSSGEALAYHLQARGRVTVVGERTPGAADHITPIRLGPSVLGLLPEAYVVDSRTGTNWEGRGVVPDVSCPAGEAVAAALTL